MKLYHLLKPEFIKLNIEAHDRMQVIGELVDLLGKSGAISNADQVKELVTKRELEVGTGIGNGVAIPHSDPGPFPKPLAAFVSLGEGVDFGAPDNQPVRLAFLILTPAKAATLHVRMLARLCRILKSEDIRNQLLTATTPHTAADILAQAESGFPEITP